MNLNPYSTEGKFMAQLPEQCRDIDILPHHKVALEHRIVGNDVWVVLLTRMPNKPSQAWKLSKKEYYAIYDTHVSRDRYVRNRLTPTIESEPFVTDPVVLDLF